jgi:hypothetical protein
MFISFRLSEGNRYAFQGDWHDLKNHNSEVLFVGNSRTWVHLNAMLFENKTKLKSEVIAQDGQDAEIAFYKLQEYLKYNKPPRILILQYDANFFGKVNSLYGYENYAPHFFFLRFRKFTLNLRNRNGYNPLGHILPLVAFNETIKSKKYLKRMILGIKISSRESWINTKGYIGQKKNAEFGKIPDSFNIKIDQYNPFIDSFFALSSRNNVKIIGVFTPITKQTYARIKNPEILSLTFNKSKSFYNTTGYFHNFNNLTFCTNNQLFYNHLHLNKQGSDSLMQAIFRDTFFMNEFN